MALLRPLVEHEEQLGDEADTQIQDCSMALFSNVWIIVARVEPALMIRLTSLLSGRGFRSNTFLCSNWLSLKSQQVLICQLLTEPDREILNIS
jgi:frataxin-like iron-binding protein CyaY